MFMIKWMRMKEAGLGKCSPEKNLSLYPLKHLPPYPEYVAEVSLQTDPAGKPQQPPSQQDSWGVAVCRGEHLRRGLLLSCLRFFLR